MAFEQGAAYRDDATIAVEEAMQMAERMGEDVAILPNLQPVLLRCLQSACLEIIRCPQALKKAADTD